MRLLVRLLVSAAALMRVEGAPRMPAPVPGAHGVLHESEACEGKCLNPHHQTSGVCTSGFCGANAACAYGNLPKDLAYRGVKGLLQ